MRRRRARRRLPRLRAVGVARAHPRVEPGASPHHRLVSPGARRAPTAHPWMDGYGPHARTCVARRRVHSPEATRADGSRCEPLRLVVAAAADRARIDLGVLERLPRGSRPAAAHADAPPHQGADRRLRRRPLRRADGGALRRRRWRRRGGGGGGGGRWLVVGGSHMGALARAAVKCVWAALVHARVDVCRADDVGPHALVARRHGPQQRRDGGVHDDRQRRGAVPVPMALPDTRPPHHQAPLLPRRELWRGGGRLGGGRARRPRPTRVRRLRGLRALVASHRSRHARAARRRGGRAWDAERRRGAPSVALLAPRGARQAQASVHTPPWRGVRARIGARKAHPLHRPRRALLRQASCPRPRLRARPVRMHMH